MNTYEDIKALVTRLDSIANAPVQEDEETHPLWGDWGTTPQEWSDTHVANNDDMVMAIAKGEIPPKPVTLSSYFDEQNDLWPEGVEGGKYNDEQIIDIISDTVGYDCRALGYDYLVKIRDGEVKGMYKPTPEQIKTAQEIIKNPEFAKAKARNSRPMESTSEDSDKMARLKELSGIKEDAGLTDQQKKGLEAIAKKYKGREGGNGDELARGHIKALTSSGITTDGFDVEEMEAYAKKIGKDWPEWEDKEIDEFLKQAPITSGMIDDMIKVLGPDWEQNQKLSAAAADVLDTSAGFVPMPEADEFDINEDEDFEEVLGVLGFPEDELWEAEYRGRKVKLNKPMRGDVKKFKVFVKDPKTGNVKKVNFGHGGTSAKKLGQKTMRIRKSDPARRRSFRARHNCANPGPKTKARYWSCRKW